MSVAPSGLKTQRAYIAGSAVVVRSESAPATWGNIIAELDATGATLREYIWLVEAEIAPTRGSRTNVDRPVAVISGATTTTGTDEI